MDRFRLFGLVASRGIAGGQTPPAARLIRWGGKALTFRLAEELGRDPPIVDDGLLGSALFFPPFAPETNAFVRKLFFLKIFFFVFHDYSLEFIQRSPELQFSFKKRKSEFLTKICKTN